MMATAITNTKETGCLCSSAMQRKPLHFLHQNEGHGRSTAQVGPDERKISSQLDPAARLCRVAQGPRVSGEGVGGWAGPHFDARSPDVVALWVLPPCCLLISVFYAFYLGAHPLDPLLDPPRPRPVQAQSWMVWAPTVYGKLEANSDRRATCCRG